MSGDVAKVPAIEGEVLEACTPIVKLRIPISRLKVGMKATIDFPFHDDYESQQWHTFFHGKKVEIFQIHPDGCVDLVLVPGQHQDAYRVDDPRSQQELDFLLHSKVQNGDLNHIKLSVLIFDFTDFIS